LLQKYQASLAENKALKEENEPLRARLGMADPLESRPSPEGIQQHAAKTGPACQFKDVTDSTDKIRLFMSLFEGRDYLYAKRWESMDGRSGYAPVCLNEWKRGLCGKPGVKCAFCKNRSYPALDEEVIEAHLMGNLVAGILLAPVKKPAKMAGLKPSRYWLRA